VLYCLYRYSGLGNTLVSYEMDENEFTNHLRKFIVVFVFLLLILQYLLISECIQQGKTNRA
jgi:hypothetical protein